MPPLRYQKKDVNEVEPNNLYDDITSNTDPIKPACIHVILLNRTLRLLLVLTISGILIPCIIYAFLFSVNVFEPAEQIGTCAHAKIFQIKCGHENITDTACLNRGCCYTTMNGCYHALPSRHQYKVNGTWNPSQTLIPSRQITPFGFTSLPQLRLSVAEISNKRVKFEFWDPQSIEEPAVVQPVNNSEYTYNIFSTIMIEVFRKKDNQMLLTTARGPLIVSNNYFEWTAHLGTNFLFGLGGMELKPGEKKLLINTENSTALPYILAYSNISNDFHGLLFSSPGPVEVEILASSLIVFRGLINHNFFIELLMGPTPRDLLEQIRMYREPYVPPYWGYGVHICRKSADFNIIAAEKELDEFLEKSNNAVPFDSHCFLDNLVWLTNQPILSNNILNNVEKLKNRGKKFLASIMTQLQKGSDAYNSAMSMQLLLQERNIPDPYEGIVDNQTVVYIDWLGDTNNLTKWINQYWTSIFNLQVDGFLLKNNWMSDETRNISRQLEKKYFSYSPEGINEKLSFLLPWYTKLTSNTTHSSVLYSYNMIGNAQASILINNSNFKNNKLLMTTDFTTNVPAAVIMQNFLGSWTNLRAHVRQLLGGCLLGINVIGSSVCGDFNGTVNEKLCIRWYQFASLTPIFRVLSDRTPNTFSEYALQIMNAAIRRRYSLISYFHSTMIFGFPLNTPMFYLFPKLAINSSDYSEQFFIGDALLAAPVLAASLTNKRIYFPDKYYELTGGHSMEHGWTDLSVVEADLPLFIRKGHVVPIHSSENVLSAEEARLTPLHLIIALDCMDKNATNKCNAIGKLYITKHFYWTFEANEKEIRVNITNSDHNGVMCDITEEMSSKITKLQVYGIPDETNSIFEKNIDINICDGTESNKTYIVSYENI